MIADGGVLGWAEQDPARTFLLHLQNLDDREAKEELRRQDALWRRDGTLEAARRLALTSRKHEDAAATLAKVRELLATHSDDPLLLAIESESLLDLDEAHPALTSARRAVRVAPDLAAPWMALARALMKSGRPDDAVTASLSACRAEPRNASPGTLLAELAAKAGLNAAELKLRVVANPSPVTAGELFGEALLASDANPEDALALIEGCVGLALPDTELYRVAALIQERNGNLRAALAHLETAIETDSSDAILFDKVRLLIELDRHRDAAELCDKLLAKGTQFDAAFACQRAKAAINLGEHGIARKLLTEYEVEIFALFGMGSMMTGVEVYCDDDPARFLRHAKQTVTASSHHGQPPLPLFMPAPQDTNQPKRPRIGLLSNNFSAHPVSFLTLAGFEKLADAGFEITCFETYGQKHDPWKGRFRVLAKEWHELQGMTPQEAATAVAKAGVDILIDLQGFSRKATPEIILRKPAPIIVKWVGMQATSSGMPEMDYFLSDPIETPHGFETFYSEKLIRLNRSYVAFEPPDVSKLPGTPPCLRHGFITFGSFNNIQKITPETLDAWCRILHAVPESKLLVKAPQLSNQEPLQTLANSLSRRGIPVERLMFMGRSSREAQLTAIASVDVALDPFPYSGGVCTLEALTVGVPVVTLAGRSFAARHSASHLTWSGAPELVATSVEAYVDIAVKLAGDPDRIAAYRRSLPEGLAQPGGPADIAGFVQDMTGILENLGSKARVIRAQHAHVTYSPSPLPITAESKHVVERAFDLGEGQFSPSWAMPRATLGMILDRCVVEKPGAIMEFGSGVSTVALLLSAERLGLDRLVSFEHEPEWAERVRSWASAIGKQDLLDLRLRPLTRQNWGGLSGMFYDLNDTDLSLACDCVIVDGPPSGTTQTREHRRAMAGRAIEHCLRDGGLAFLEDAHRTWETDAYGRWVERRLFDKADLFEVGRGLFVGRRNRNKDS